MPEQHGLAETDIRSYTCYRTREPLRIDGLLDETAWTKAPKSPRFVDMVTGDPGFFDTYMAALWDDRNFYVGFWVEEPFVTAALTERDSLIFNDNDVEVFIDGGDCYYEFEINALSTIYEVFYIWQDVYKRGGRFDVPEFDLLAQRGLSFGGDYDRTPQTFWRGTHPRGCRWAFRDWDFPGLQWAVHVDGKINDRFTVDRGWTVEIAFPWEGMKWLAQGGRSLPPRDGDEWRIFFGRFEKLLAAGRELQPHPAWVLSKHDVYDTHMPERFPRIRFSETDVEGR